VAYETGLCESMVLSIEKLSIIRNGSIRTSAYGSITINAGNFSIELLVYYSSPSKDTSINSLPMVRTLRHTEKRIENEDSIKIKTCKFIFNEGLISCMFTVALT
jgi:hypothetical protein